jgi:hypothetical protein
MDASSSSQVRWKGIAFIPMRYVKSPCLLVGSGKACDAPSIAYLGYIDAGI